VDNQSSRASVPSFFDQLKLITTSDRENAYGHPLWNFLRIAIRWNLYFGSRIDMVISPVDVALMMIEMKIARLQNSFTDDSILDIAGYSSCVARMDEKLKELGMTDGVKIFSRMNVTDMIELLKEHGE
jgi:hypothetical protein